MKKKNTKTEGKNLQRPAKVAVGQETQKIIMHVIATVKLLKR